MGTIIRKVFVVICLCYCFILNTSASSSKYRLMFNGDPSKEVTIGFDAEISALPPKIYYSTTYINTSNLNNYLSKAVDRKIDYLKMVNCYVTLKNLQAGKKYYFVVYNNGQASEVFNFETISNSSTTKLSIVAGSDSRNNSHVRIRANKMVAKLKPHVVLFAGDMTDNSTASEWARWFEDWQYTIDENNRITPIVAARGNHENNNKMLSNLFDTPESVSYASSFGGNLLRTYTLNSESYVIQQNKFLKDDLAANANHIWKIAQYHSPMRSHSACKLEGSAQYANWANLFYQYGVNVVVEGDSHLVKTTWPVSPCTGGFNCELGFKRDDKNGTVYVGEGTWGAPLRQVNDNKRWTRDSGSFNQFKLFFVDKKTFEIRTIKYDNVDEVSAVSISNRFALPAKLDVWEPESGNGKVAVLSKLSTDEPVCNLVHPKDNKIYTDLNSIQLEAATSGTNSISHVKFYVDGALVHTDYTKPYAYKWKPAAYKTYIVSAIASNSQNLSSTLESKAILVSPATITSISTIEDGHNDASEKYNKQMALTNYNVRIASSDKKIQGLRFTSPNIPQNASIKSASIQFIAAGSAISKSNKVEIYCENSAKAAIYNTDNGNISSRNKLSDYITWQINGKWYDGNSTSAQKSPELKTLIQQLVDRSDWEVTSPIAFILKGEGVSRSAKSFEVGARSNGGSCDENGKLAPVLRIKYTKKNELSVSNSCSIISPENNSKFLVNETITISASASENVAEVKFIDGTTTLYTDKYAPYSFLYKAINAENKKIRTETTYKDGSKCTAEVVLEIEGFSCNKVSNIKAFNLTNSSAKITWNTGGASNYTLEFKASNEASWQKRTVSLTYYNLNGLKSNTTYYYRIISNCAGSSITSSIYNFKTLAGAVNQLCDKPIGMVESNIQGGSVLLKWSGDTNSTYRVYYKVATDYFWKNKTSNKPELFLNGLNGCTSYQWYLVKLCADDKDSKTSLWRTFSTTNCKVSNDLNEQNIKAFPLPFKENLTVEFQLSSADVSLIKTSLHDVTGKLVAYKEIVGNKDKKNEVQFDTNNLSSGIYFVEINNGFKAKSIKVVK